MKKMLNLTMIMAIAMYTLLAGGVSSNAAEVQPIEIQPMNICFIIPMFCP